MSEESTVTASPIEALPITEDAAEAAPCSPAIDTPPPSPGDWPPPPLPGQTSVLERLGSSPLPRGKFPFLGILASIYEHVHDQTHQR